MNIKCFFAIAAAILFSTASWAQRQPAELPIEFIPQRPMDTIPTEDPDTKIIIYTNNTWSYYRPTIDTHPQAEAYTSHWDTTGVFAYRDIAYEALPPTVELSLVDDLSEFKAPIVGKVFSKYGPRRRRPHNGVDIPLMPGEPIFATFEGKVRYAKYNSGGFGYLVILRHPNGLETWHGHLSRLNVDENDYVKCGQVIGFGGNTGRSRGPHLHYEVRYRDQTFDPEFIIDFETGQLKYTTFALEKSFFNINSRASEILEEDDEYDFELLAEEGVDTTSSADILERIMAAQERIDDVAAAKANGATVSASGAVYHTVVSGDMLGKLAIKYGVSIDQLCRLNGITRTSTLRLKQRLRIK